MTKKGQILLKIELEDWKVKSIQFQSQNRIFSLPLNSLITQLNTFNLPPSTELKPLACRGGLSRQSTADSSELSMVSQVSISSISSVSVPEIQNIAGCVWDLSQRSKGCRLVQQALDAASDTERTNLAQEGLVGSADVRVTFMN